MKATEYPSYWKVTTPIHYILAMIFRKYQCEKLLVSLIVPGTIKTHDI